MIFDHKTAWQIFKFLDLTNDGSEGVLRVAHHGAKTHPLKKVQT